MDHDVVRAVEALTFVGIDHNPGLTTVWATGDSTREVLAGEDISGVVESQTVALLAWLAVDLRIGVAGSPAVNGVLGDVAEEQACVVRNPDWSLGKTETRANPRMRFGPEKRRKSLVAFNQQRVPFRGSEPK